MAQNILFELVAAAEEQLNVIKSNEAGFRRVINLATSALRYDRGAFDVRLYSMRANANSNIGFVGKAISDATKAIALAPENPELFLSRAFYYRDCRMYNKTLDDLDVAIRLGLDDPSLKELMEEVTKEMLDAK